MFAESSKGTNRLRSASTDCLLVGVFLRLFIGSPPHISVTTELSHCRTRGVFKTDETWTD